MATEYLFSNNATTTLAQSVSATATVLNVASGTGDLFPSPTSGQAFAVTLVDAATGATNEICYCTSRSGDQLTVTRGQEGTNATAWQAGDTCAHYITAGGLSGFLQQDDSSRFLQLDSPSAQTVAGAITFSGVTNVPTPTDYTQNQAIGVRDADKRYASISYSPFTDNKLRVQAYTLNVGDDQTHGGFSWDIPFSSDPVFCVATPINSGDSEVTVTVARLNNTGGIFACFDRSGNRIGATISVLVGGYMED